MNLLNLLHKGRSKYRVQMNAFVLFLLFVPLFISGVQAQKISVGGAYIYGDDIQNSGIHFRSYYNLKNDRICFGPEYSYFFSSTERINGEEITKSLNEINLNGHFIFELGEKWGLYPLTGLNLSFEKEEYEMESISETKTALGVNLGIGLHRAVGKAIFFTEYDHLFSDLSQNSFLVGVFFNFGGSKSAGEE